MSVADLTRRLDWGLIPAVPVPFHGTSLAVDAQTKYAAWMARQAVAGVAVWAHTGRGPHLSAEQRGQVLATWRAALPGKVIVAGVTSDEMARDAATGGADAVLAFPRRDDPVGHHRALGTVLPVVAFYLYEAAGGVAYDDPTLHGILGLPTVVGIKVATLDDPPAFRRIAGIVRDHPGKLLITGEDRFLGESIGMGARAALIGMGSALTAMQADLLRARGAGDTGAFARLSAECDRFAVATFGEPVEGYVRRMLWALAADGVIPDDACDDPWGPPLPDAERAEVRRAVERGRAARV